MFLDDERGPQVAMAIEAHGDLTGNPIHLYWTYIASRTSRLGLAVPASLEEKTFARLACITRCVSRAELTALKTQWFSMSATDRCFLCSRLVADGISEQAFVFEELPKFFANVKSNPTLTLKDGLNLLIDSIGRIEESILESGETLIAMFFLTPS